ncbi:glutathione-dependent reductase [Virgisporangium aliadipatigenens]|uniref:Glutathione-dependent reductase n=2 Tax=Virgisporangium aliadipatigenens TaxID=741659 RepID=A0A8J3YKE6_9ACTN|nr:glutathione-dependent reductase [Virgisporangium aliadipatigenens]
MEDMRETAAQFSRESAPSGEFVRQPNRFTDPVTAEAGRYVLYASLACPWAHRSIIVRELLGLQEALPLRIVDPIRDEKGWRFTLDPDGRDPVTGALYLSELYLGTDPAFEGRVTVPAVWDTVTSRVVSNDYPRLTLTWETTFAPLHRPGAPDLYPEPLRAEIDALNDELFRDVNNGVYRCGFATTQSAYEAAFHALFARLDVLEERLGERRYLHGDAITDSDVRLYTTLVRFDAVYHGHFKCNLRKLAEYPHLWGYARDLYRTPGFGSTTDFDHIKRHYYVTHERINPTRIVPLGPDPALWETPHGRG